MCDCADEKGMKQGEIRKQAYSLPDLSTKQGCGGTQPNVRAPVQVGLLPPSGFI
jgi:hypothetical protein